jgi:S1-C subfamily serine protease
VKGSALAAVLIVAAGCATTAERPAPTRVLARILDVSVQVVLERGTERLRTGSGVVVGRQATANGTQCFIVTSGHTFARVPPDTQILVLFNRHRGPGSRAKAELLASRETDLSDLALLRAQTADGCAAPPAWARPELGESIWTVGFPWGRDLRLAAGVVSQVALDDAGEKGHRFMIDASVAYGASGGGVFEQAGGRLLGIVEGYGTARVPFGDRATRQYLDVPVPGETFVIGLEALARFLHDTGHAALLGLADREGARAR